MRPAYFYRSMTWLLPGLVLTTVAAALSPDPKVLSLIPRSAQIVDGSGVSPSRADRRKLLIFTQESALDLDDFVALVGVDDSKFIRQVFLVSGREGPNSQVEHSVLAIGHFIQSRIYGAAIQNGAQARNYRGIEIIELSSFSRDRGGANDLRWMAVIGSELVVFGTVTNVREELDRYIGHAPADSALLKRMARLHPDDETWCLLQNMSHYEEIRQDLGSLDSRFLQMTINGSQFDFGIRYGRKFRLDYVSRKPSWTGAALIGDAQSESNGRTDPTAQSFISNPDSDRDGSPRHEVISISRTRYEKWLSELSQKATSPNDSHLAHHSR
jgi:hypothetical protein